MKIDFIRIIFFIFYSFLYNKLSSQSDKWSMLMTQSMQIIRNYILYYAYDHTTLIK